MLKFVKGNVQFRLVVGVLRSHEGVPGEIERPHDGVAGLHQGKSVVGNMLKSRGDQVHSDLSRKVSEALVTEYLCAGHAKREKGETV